MLNVCEAWRTQYPDATVGLLVVSNVDNTATHPRLEEEKRRVETELRLRYGKNGIAVLKELPVIQAYTRYYKGFKKTYHVLNQLVSVIHRNKPLPAFAPLVDAMFMTELKNMLLTAGHDLDRMELPLWLSVADGSESFTRMNGEEQILKRGDMFIADGKGVISCVIYGPDGRTRITTGTRRALFTVYAPAGIDREIVRVHLEDLMASCRLFSPAAVVESLLVYPLS